MPPATRWSNECRRRSYGPRMRRAGAAGVVTTVMHHGRARSARGASSVARAMDSDPRVADTWNTGWARIQRSTCCRRRPVKGCRIVVGISDDGVTTAGRPARGFNHAGRRHLLARPSIATSRRRDRGRRYRGAAPTAGSPAAACAQRATSHGGGRGVEPRICSVRDIAPRRPLAAHTHRAGGWPPVRHGSRASLVCARRRPPARSRGALGRSLRSATACAIGRIRASGGAPAPRVRAGRAADRCVHRIARPAMPVIAGEAVATGLPAGCGRPTATFSTVLAATTSRCTGPG